MRHPDRVRLLFGPYKPPPLRRGDRATCYFRDYDVVVTGWTDGRIPWPKGLPAENFIGRPTPVVDEELARAVRHESAAALGYWWGVSAHLVCRWRRALGVGRMDNEGSRRLVLAAVEKGAAELRGVPLQPEQVERRRRTAIEKGLARNLCPPGGKYPLWTRKELALLGKLPDAEVARRTGRGGSAIRQKREELGIPNPAARVPRWTEGEHDLLRRLPPAEAARETGRTLWAVYNRRNQLGLRDGHAARARRRC